MVEALNVSLQVVPTGQAWLDIAIAKKALDEIYIHSSKLPFDEPLARTKKIGGFNGDKKKRTNLCFLIERRSQLDFFVKVSLL